MIKWLENWYKSNCNGEWEHENWIKIQSLDNPGWFLEIKVYNFFENSQEKKWRLFEESENNWIACGIVYVDIDLVQIRYENIDEKVVVNNNPKTRTYIIDENTLIYSNECKEIIPQQIVLDKVSLLKDKTIITVGSSRRGKMESINFGCYG